MKLSQDFDVKEFFQDITDPKKDYTLKEYLKTIGAQKAAWIIDFNLVKVLQFMRTKLGKRISINNAYRFSEGKISQHNFGRAADISIEGMSPVEVRTWIVSNWKLEKGLQVIRGIEDFEGMNWTHIDTRNHPTLLVFLPDVSKVWSTPVYKVIVKEGFLKT